MIMIASTTLEEIMKELWMEEAASIQMDRTSIDTSHPVVGAEVE
jgi:hypothetical protein